MDEISRVNVEDALEACTRECPSCCAEALRELEAKNEHRLANRTLTLSSVGLMTILSAHIWFTWHGRTLDIPPEMYLIFSAAFGSKLANALAKKFGSKKQ